MAGNGLDINLSRENTIIASVPVVYNIEITINLENYIEYMEEENGRIYVQTDLEIPIILNGEKRISSISLINNYKVNEVVGNKVIQFGYYEGVYDEEREIKKNSNIFIYRIK